jgi:hypothetical protein
MGQDMARAAADGAEVLRYAKRTEFVISVVLAAWAIVLLSGCLLAA